MVYICRVRLGPPRKDQSAITNLAEILEPPPITNGSALQSSSFRSYDRFRQGVGMSAVLAPPKHTAAGPYLGYALQPVRLCHHLLHCDPDYMSP